MLQRSLASTDFSTAPQKLLHPENVYICVFLYISAKDGGLLEPTAVYTRRQQMQ